jgi:4-hydroxy-3-polyprenylbenzoate decarboxylase
LNSALQHKTTQLHETPLLVLVNDAAFTAASLKNYLWVTYTRCNPSHDIYGINAFTQHKHWGCNGPMIIDARKKSHHAPELTINEQTKQQIDKLWSKGGSLYGLG